MSIERHALRINERWIHEVVERFGICPFAEPAMKAGRVARHVLLDERRAAPLLAEIANDLAFDVALFIFPRLTMSAREFDEWCRPLRSAHDAWAAAVFHPDTPYDLSTPAQAVSFFRRAPDATLQLVRLSALEGVRGNDGKFMFDFSSAAWRELERRENKLPTSQRIARDNLARLAGEGLSRLTAIYDDIRADRDRSYNSPPKGEEDVDPVGGD